MLHAVALGLAEGKDTVFTLRHTLCRVDESLRDQVQLEFGTNPRQREDDLFFNCSRNHNGTPAIKTLQVVGCALHDLGAVDYHVEVIRVILYLQVCEADLQVIEIDFTVLVGLPSASILRADRVLALELLDWGVLHGVDSAEPIDSGKHAIRGVHRLDLQEELVRFDKASVLEVLLDLEVLRAGVQLDLGLEVAVVAHFQDVAIEEAE